MILNISDAANLAIHALSYLANHQERQPVPTSVVAESLTASEAHLSKVFQRLAKAGMVRSVRGPKGGFTLAKEPDGIVLLQIYESIDGPLERGDCLLGTPACPRGHCVFGTPPAEIVELVDAHFSQTTLADLIEE